MHKLQRHNTAEFDIQGTVNLRTGEGNNRGVSIWFHRGKVHSRRNTHNEANNDLLLGLDFQQAFDKVDRKKLFTVMEEIEVPNKLIRLMQMTMNKTIASIRTTEGKTESFEINKG